MVGCLRLLFFEELRIFRNIRLSPTKEPTYVPTYLPACLGWLADVGSRSVGLWVIPSQIYQKSRRYRREVPQKVKTKYHARASGEAASLVKIIKFCRSGTHSRIWNSWNSSPDLTHGLQLRTPLPHAPGARMMVVYTNSLK